MDEQLIKKYLKYATGVAAVILAIMTVYKLATPKTDNDGTSTTTEITVSEPSPSEEKSDPAEEKTETLTLVPQRTAVSGPLHGYYEVVDRNYKVKNGKIHIELKRLKEGFPTPWASDMALGYSDGQFEPGFYVEFLDTDGDIERRDDTSIITDREALQSLADLNVDETATLPFSVKSSPMASFRVGSSFVVHEKKEPEKTETAVPNERNDEQQSASSTSRDNHQQESAASQNTAQDDDGQYDADDDDDEEVYDDDDESTWQKVKKKSKRIYRNTKRKFRHWLDK